MYKKYSISGILLTKSFQDGERCRFAAYRMAAQPEVQ